MRKLMKRKAASVLLAAALALVCFFGCVSVSVEPQNVVLMPVYSLAPGGSLKAGDIIGHLSYEPANDFVWTFSLSEGSIQLHNSLFTITGDNMLTAARDLREYNNYDLMLDVSGRNSSGTGYSTAVHFIFALRANAAAPARTAAQTNTQSGSTTSTQASRPNTIDDFEILQNEKGTITITGYKREAPRDVVIPDNIEGIAVTEIAEEAFRPVTIGPLDERKAPLTSVIIPASVITIGNEAFSGNNLASVVIPDSVTSIGNNAFYSNQLTSVVISKNLKTIPPLAFAGNKLRELTIPESVTLIRYSAFSGNQLESVVIPNGVTSIESNAFINNKLSGVTLGNSVRTIGLGAFANNQISSLVIPASVREFEGNTQVDQSGAFQNNALTSIVIPAGVTYVGEETFADNRITSVTVTSNTTTFRGIVSGGWFPDGVFTNNPITSITLPANTDFRIVSNGRQGGTNSNVFPNNFNTYYQSQGRKAGTYTWSGRLWSVK